MITLNTQRVQVSPAWTKEERDTIIASLRRKLAELRLQERDMRARFFHKNDFDANQKEQASIENMIRIVDRASSELLEDKRADFGQYVK